MMRTIAMFILYSFLSIIPCFCTSDCAPFIVHRKSTNLTQATTRFTSSTWVLDSLSPEENIVLRKGSTIPISIYMGASGEGNYILKFKTDRRKYRPFVLKIVRGSGEIDFSGRISWHLIAKGKDENITIALYQIERTESGKTEVLTLLKQFRRKYDVQNNKKVAYNSQ